MLPWRVEKSARSQPDGMSSCAFPADVARLHPSLREPRGMGVSHSPRTAAIPPKPKQPALAAVGVRTRVGRYMRQQTFRESTLLGTEG